jgi:hypothetical protein
MIANENCFGSPRGILEVTSVHLRLLLIILALVSFSKASSFDKPLQKKIVDLGPSRFSPRSRAKVSCYFYERFMVKEVDMGQKGADRLAIVPVARGEIAKCTWAREKTEKVVNPKDWTGYFKGAKNDLVYFDADDGLNGGMGFAIYDAKAGKKVFEDIAFGPVEFLESNPLTLKYTRMYDGECVNPQRNADCWERIRTKIGLTNSPVPDCQKGYEDSARNLAKGRCQAQNTDNAECLARELKLATEQTNAASSVIAYPVEVLLVARPTIKPAAGEVRC